MKHNNYCATSFLQIYLFSITDIPILNTQYLYNNFHSASVSWNTHLSLFLPIYHSCWSKKSDSTISLRFPLNLSLNLRGRKSCNNRWIVERGVIGRRGRRRCRRPADLATKDSGAKRVSRRQRRRRRQSALVLHRASIERRAAERISQPAWCEPRPRSRHDLFLSVSVACGRGTSTLLSPSSFSFFSFVSTERTSSSRDLPLIWLSLSTPLSITRYLREFHHSTR